MEYKFETYKRSFLLLIFTIIIVNILLIFVCATYFHYIFFIDMNPFFSLILFMVFDFALFELFVLYRFFEQPITVRIETMENGVIIEENGSQRDEIPYEKIIRVISVPYLTDLTHSLRIISKGYFKNYFIEKELAEKIVKDIKSKKTSLNKPVIISLEPGFSNLAVDSSTNRNAHLLGKPNNKQSQSSKPKRVIKP